VHAGLSATVNEEFPAAMMSPLVGAGAGPGAGPVAGPGAGPGAATGAAMGAATGAATGAGAGAAVGTAAGAGAGSLLTAALMPVAGPPILFASAAAFVVALLNASALDAKIISNASFSVSVRCLSSKPTRLRASAAVTQASFFPVCAAIAVAGPGAGEAVIGASACAVVETAAGARAVVVGNQVTCAVEQVVPVTRHDLTQSAWRRFSALSHLSSFVHGLHFDGSVWVPGALHTKPSLQTRWSSCLKLPHL